MMLRGAGLCCSWETSLRATMFIPIYVCVWVGIRARMHLIDHFFICEMVKACRVLAELIAHAELKTSSPEAVLLLCLCCLYIYIEYRTLVFHTESGQLLISQLCVCVCVPE